MRLSTRPLAAFLAFAAMVLSVLGLTAGVAAAHTGDQSYVYLEVFDDSIDGHFDLPVADLATALGLDIPEDEASARPVLDAHREEILAYLAENFEMQVDGQVLPIEFLESELPFYDLPQGSYAVYAFEMVGTVDRPPTIDVRYELFLDEVDNHSALLLIENNWRDGVYANEAVPSLVYDSGDRVQSLDLEGGSFWKGFRGVIDLGVDHIRIGTDHIFFIIALLLPAVMVWRASSWQPAPTFRSSLWRVLKIATMFTVAHSVTLSLAGLDIINPPGRPVEALIAFSIVLAALHNLRPIAAEKEPWIAFSFGLFHGMGFASLLGGLGLDRGNRVWSLLAFNLGVEVGQVAIILLVFPVLYVARRLPAYQWIMRGLSVLLALVGSLWLAERVLLRDLRVSQVVDPLVEYPRVLIALALALAAAGAAYYSLRQRDALVPVPVGSEEGIAEGEMASRSLSG